MGRRKFLRIHVRRLLRVMRLMWHVLMGVAVTYTVMLPLNKVGYHRHQRVLVQWWARKACRILHLEISSEGACSSTQPTLFVANHISWLDIPCLLSTLDAVCVAKHEIKHWPLVGRMAIHAGTVFIRRGEHAATDVAEQMAHTLANNKSIVLFPEGTSTSGETVRTFHSRLYQAAIHTHSLVQAVALAYPHPSGVHPAAPYVGDVTLFQHLWRIAGESAIPVKLTFCIPLPTATSGRRTLAADTHTQIMFALKKSHSVPEKLRRGAA